MSFVLVSVVSVALTGGLLWAVAKWSGFALPTPDLLIIVLLCNGLAGIGWVFGTTRVLGASWVLGIGIMWLLVTHSTRAEVWPDALLMVAGSGAIWIVVFTTLVMLRS